MALMESGAACSHRGPDRLSAKSPIKLVIRQFRYTDDRELQGLGHKDGRLRWGQSVGSDDCLIRCGIEPREI